MSLSATIQSIHAREVLDSRGNPTIEAEVHLDNAICARFIAPSGASTGEYESVEKRDGGTRYLGKGVNNAIKSVVDEILPALKGMKVDCQRSIDDKLIALDGSSNKERLGGNSLIAVSVAVKKAAVMTNNCPLYAGFGHNPNALPVPLMNIINGGAHALNNLDIQEYMIVPHGFTQFPEALQAGTEVFHTLRQLLNKEGYSTAVGDEGGFAPSLDGSTKALDFILSAIEQAGYRPQEQISIALDCAASEFYDHNKNLYCLPAENFTGDAEAMIDLLSNWVQKYPIISLEDACDENDWDGWAQLTQRLGKSVQLVGDDLFVTNPTILQKGIDAGIANALLVKANQIGTVTEMQDAVEMAHAAGYNSIMSHRSGESENAEIADMAVALSCGQIKIGAPCRGERIAKYNQLLRIADALGETATYIGNTVFSSYQKDNGH